MYDKLCLFDEVVSDDKFTVKELLVPIFEKGRLVYKLPSLQESKDYAQAQLDLFDEKLKSIKRPSSYKLYLSPKLQKLKRTLLKKAKQ